MQLEAGEETRDNMPKYGKLLIILDLENISISSVYRWNIELGYHYDANRWCYYTDGHERNIVVKDREDYFLVYYFRYEMRAHRWVQVTDKVGIKIE